MVMKYYTTEDSGGTNTVKSLQGSSWGFAVGWGEGTWWVGRLTHSLASMKQSQPHRSCRE